MTLDIRQWGLRDYVNAVLVVGLALVPVYALATGNPFVMTLLTRALIYAIAAMSLNLIMGYGGLVSFGHAMFIGFGGYAVGIMAFHGNSNGLLQFPLAILVSAILALVVGTLSLQDPRRLLHHDHAGVRADGVFRRRRPGSLRRGRRHAAEAPLDAGAGRSAPTARSSTTSASPCCWPPSGWSVGSSTRASAW